MRSFKSKNSTKGNASWGKLQPELAAESHKFASQAHQFTAKELSDTLKSENATRNIERLSRMSREEIESEYKYHNVYQ